MEGTIQDKSGFWLILTTELSGSRILAITKSKLGALFKAREISVQTSSWTEAPSRIVCLETRETLNAYDIMNCWRSLGWANSSPYQ